MTYPTKPPNPEFHKGDEVVLMSRTYKGTPVIFLEVRHDANWADIKDWNGNTRSDPFVWLKPSPSPLLRNPG